MRKFLFGIPAIAILSIVIDAKISDHDQMHHDSMTKAKPVMDKTMKKARHVMENKEHGTFLAAPKVIDSGMDLEKTMKLMGKNFKALNKASELKAMVPPARNLKKWAGQAQALGVQEVRQQSASVAQQQRFQQAMISLREQIAVLEAALEKGDKDRASLALKQLNEIRKRNHKLFK